MSLITLECPNGRWTAHLERQLQRTWSIDDHELLYTSKPNEESLWVACHAIFGLTPPDILPENVSVDTTGNTPICTIDGRQLKNINWSSTVCNSFSKLIKCPIFYKDLSFLRYTLQYALFLRLEMSNGREKPTEPNFNRDMASDIINDLMELVEDPELRKQMIKRIPKVTERIEARYGAKSHPHIGLIEVLKGTVKAGYYKKSTGLILKDIKCVLEAWKVYATAKKIPQSVQILLHRSGNLPPDEDERRKALKLREYDFHGTKKAYILNLRRTAAEADDGWKRGAEVRFGEAVEVGKIYIAEEGSDDDDGADNNGSDHDSSNDNGSDHDGLSDDELDYDGSDQSDSHDPNEIASEKREMVRTSEDLMAGQGVIANLRRKLVPDGRESANKRLRSDLEQVPANDGQSSEQSAPKAVEEARNIWNELAPGFSLPSIPAGNPNSTTYNQMLGDSMEAWQTAKGCELWAAASTEARKIILDQLLDVEDRFASIPNRQNQNEVIDNIYYITQIRWLLHSKMDGYGS